MTVLAAWRPATSYAKGATVRPNAAQGSVPVAIANGSFNAGDTSWTKDAGWAINTGNTYEGTHKAEYTGTGSGTIKTSGTYPATPGQVITATVKAKVSDAADGATALLLWYDSSNVLISTSTGLESSVETGVWMQLEVAGVGPDGAAFVTFAVEATRTVGPNVLIDDARWNYSAPIEARRMAYRAVQESAGVSGVVEPTWPTTLGARVTDGTVIWEAVQVSWIEWTARPLLESGLSEPAWPTTVGAFVSDGTINWECTSRRVEDEKCPQSKVVAIIASKVFAADKDIVRFSATANPLDWSTRDDAGYLPTGLQQSNANDLMVLQPYRGNLGGWNASVFQMWQVDPDPTNMALLDQMDGVGSTHTLAATAVGNDLYYLAAPGVRSVGIANAAENLQAGDVGMPIDVLVQAAMAQSIIDGTKALSTYWPGMGQYWLTFGDDGQTAGAGGALRLICAPPNGGVGEPYSYTYTATGGTAPYTFSVVSGSLPPGVTLNSSTGHLSGTPTTDGVYSFAVAVTDDIGVIAYCGGWSAEPVEDEVEINERPNHILITGTPKESGGPMYAAAEAGPIPVFTGIEQSTGADATGLPYWYNGTWGVVSKDTVRYSLDNRESWLPGTRPATTVIENVVAGHDGWLTIDTAKTLFLNGAWYASDPPSTWTLSPIAGTLYISYARGKYWSCWYSRLYSATSPDGPWTDVSYGDTGPGNPIITEWIDIVEFGGVLAATVITNDGKRSIRTSSDGAVWSTVLLEMDSGHPSWPHWPYWLCVAGGKLVCSAWQGGLWTDANAWAALLDPGIVGSTASSGLYPYHMSGGRKIASANGRAFIIGSNNGLTDDSDKCVVFDPLTMEFSAPITMPITGAIGIASSASENP